MRLLLPLIATFLFLPGAASAELIDDFQPNFVPGELIITGDNQELSNLDLNRAGVVSKEELVPGEVWLVNLKNGVSVQEGKSRLLAEEGGLAVELNTRFETASLPPLVEPVPNDTSFSSLWGMQNTGQTVDGVTGTAGADIKARYAWQLEKGSAGDVVVGVVDTGIDLQHTDLDDKIWQNPGEIAGNNIDDDSNGYIDDSKGWNWVSNNSNADDDHNHGTHVAGTIAAESNNSKGVTGVSWGARLAPLKVLSSSGSGSLSSVISAFNYAGAMGMEVVNASLGGPSSSAALLTSVQNYPATLYVFAAGNDASNLDTTPSYPCSLNSANVICVGASTQTDTLASFSNYGATEVDLVAPGVNILSTYPRNASGDSYQILDGTSMATPMVAGVAALMRQYRPNGAAADYKDILIDTVDTKAAFTGKTVSGGRLNAYSALVETAARNPGASPPTVAITSSRPAWFNTRSPSWEFSLSGATSATCSLSGSSSWSGSCTSSYQASNLVEGGSYTFRVEATNSFGTASAEHQFQIDTVVPSAPTITEKPASQTSSTSALFRATGETGATWSCNMGSGWLPCNGAISGSEISHSVSSLTEGSYTFSVRQTDRAGNISPSASASFAVDVTPPPAPTIISKPAGLSNSSSAAITFQSTFSASCSINQGAYQSCTSPLSLTGLSEGAQSVRIRQTDLAGNTSQPVSAEWNIDLTAPVAPLISGPSGTTAFRNITFGFTGEEGASFRCALDSAPLTSCTAPLSFENLSDGDHSFRVVQIDIAGNQSLQQTREFSVSGSGEEIVFTSVPPAVSKEKSPLFSWEISPSVSTVSCSLVPVAASPSYRSCQSDTTDSANNLSDNTYSFRVKVEDANGSWLIKEHQFRIDTVSPTMSLQGPSGLHASRQATYSWSASEESSFKCSLDNQPLSSCASPFVVNNLQEGSHSFLVQAEDAAGNTSSLSRSFQVDVTPPAAPTLELFTGDRSPAEVALRGEGSFICQLDSGSWADCTSPWKSNLPDGSHTLRVRAKDPAGNLSSTAEVSWFVGLPRPSLQGPDDLGRVFFSGAKGDAEYLCSFNNEALKVCSNPVAPILPNGTYPYRLQIREGSRLSEEVRGAISISGAPAPPAGPVGVSLNQGALYTNDPNVSVSSVWPAGARLMVIASDGSFQGETRQLSAISPWTLPLSGAERLPKTVYVRFLGAANQILYSGSDDIILDTTSPNIRRLNGDQRKGAYRVTVNASDNASGIDRVQFSSSRDRPGYNEGGSWRALDDGVFRSRGKLPEWGRLRDKAGNKSAWVRIR